ncbi:MAG: tRNA pseudouridine(55) synthase TruB [Acidobacteriota bacterium]|nr:tRNA pseudouridine(55) synthase TruB [Acidobacteriota bacterium]
MNGVLVVDKPAGPTSHDVVSRVRRALRTKRIGHTGTLDPLATGVLPLVIGRATRLASLLSGADKEYDAGVRLGLATETYDASDRVGPPPDPPPDIDFLRVDAALAEFRGTYDQAPPAYSAKKIDGVAAYKLARRHTPVQPRSVQVTVAHLALHSYDRGLARLRVRASAGFYVRSLAHDLGERLGCGAHLETLRRVRAGAYGEESAIRLDAIEAEGPSAGRLIVPLEQLLPEVPAVVLNDRGARRAAHGNELTPEDLADPSGLSRRAEGASAPCRFRLMDGGGMLLGIAESRPGGLLHPVIVLV